MPPINSRRLYSGLSSLRTPLSSFGRGELTQAEQELKPYLSEEERRREQRRGLLQPVEAVFDVLQRPQYATANIAEEIINAFRGQQANLGQAFTSGITGERKGSFENVLFGGQSEGAEESFRGLVPVEDEPGGGRKFIRGAGGFLANVIFDPLTYVGAGPTRAAQAAAREFAKRSVKQAFSRASNLGRLRNIVPDIADDVVRLTKEGDVAKAADLLTNRGAGDFAREMDRLYTDAYREGLRLTPERAQQQFLKNLGDEKEEVTKAAQGLAENYQIRRYRRLTERIQDTDDVKKVRQLTKERARINSPERLEEWREGIARVMRGEDAKLPDWIKKRATNTRDTRLSAIEQEIKDTSNLDNLLEGQLDETGRIISGGLRGLGERATQLFGREVGTSVRQPNAVSRSIQDLAKQFRKTVPGSKFTDAWWSTINRGPIGAIRRALGFRNPYQRMLREMELDNRTALQLDVEQDTGKMMDAITGVEEETLSKYFAAVGAAEAAGPGTKIGDILSDPGVLQRAGISADEVGQILEVASKVKSVTDDFAREFLQWHAAGYVRDINIIQNYLPAYMKETGVFKRAAKARGTPDPTFRRTRTYGLEETTAQEVAKMRLLMGVDEDTARQLVMEGASSQVTNVRELLAARAIAQSKVRARVNMLEKFREFGVNLNEIKPRASLGKSDVLGEAADIREYNKRELWAGLMRPGGLQQIGLKNVPDPFFHGYLFDDEVSEILNRVVTMVDGDEGTKRITGMLRKFSSWWKSVVTTSPGFHMRNMYSNNITLFLRHGADAFNPEFAIPAMVGTMRALHGEKGLELARKALGTSTVQRMLAKQFGGASIDDWSKMAVRNGVISKHVMAGSQEQTIGKLAGTTTAGAQRLNPFSQQFAPFEASKELGAVVESVPRFQSFIMDIAKMNRGGTQATAAQVEWAKLQAKKWFLDYTDLCFDIETEILTETGWKTWETIAYGEKALSYSLERDRLEWTDIEYIHINADYSGPMIHMKNHGFDAMVTPEHKWVKLGGDRGGHWTKRLNAGKPMLMTTSELLEKKYRLLKVAAEYEGIDQPIYHDRFVELIGWVLTEGTYPKRWPKKSRAKNVPGHLYFYQSEKHNPAYVAEIRHMVAELDGVVEVQHDHPQGRRTFYVNAKVGREIRALFPDKQLSVDFLTKLTKRQLHLLLDTLMKGDGDNRGCFVQKDERFVGAFQALCMLCGRKSTATMRDGVYQAHAFREKRALYTDSLTVTRGVYEGTIWCIHTPNHTVVARRKGTTYISGNTDFEQRFMKNLIPFYAWVRKNLANQVAGIIEQPYMYAIIPKATEAAREGLGVARDVVPEWMQEMGMFPIGEQDPKNTIMFRPNFPYQDLNIIPVLFEGREGEGVAGLPGVRLQFSELIHDIANAAHPTIKSLVGVTTNKDIFRREELRATAPAPRALRFLTKQKGLLTLLDGMMRTAFPGGDGLHIGQDERGRLTMDARIAYVLENNVPVLDRMAEWMDVPIYAAGQLGVPLEQAIEEMTGAVDDYDGLEAALQLLSQNLGVKMKVLDEDQAKLNRAYELYGAAQQRRGEARRELPGYQMRSLEARRRQRDTFRRLGLLR